MDLEELKPIETDVPCHACGYNLRGLSPRGKCPECGGDIRSTLHLLELAAAERRHRYVSRATKLQWTEGVACLLIWFVVSAAAGFDDTHRHQSYLNRSSVLVVLVAAWSIGYLGIWKIARSDPKELAPRDVDGPSHTLRFLIIAGGLFPFVWGVESLWMWTEPEISVAPILVAVIITAPVLHFRLARIARMISSKSLAVQFDIFVIVVPLALAILLALAGTDVRSSLDFAEILPSPSFVTSLWVSMLFHNPMNDPVFYVVAASLAWPPVTLVFLFFKLKGSTVSADPMSNAGAKIDPDAI